MEESLIKDYEGTPLQLGDILGCIDSNGQYQEYLVCKSCTPLPINQPHRLVLEDIHGMPCRVEDKIFQGAILVGAEDKDRDKLIGIKRQEIYQEAEKLKTTLLEDLREGKLSSSRYVSEITHLNRARIWAFRGDFNPDIPDIVRPPFKFNRTIKEKWEDLNREYNEQRPTEKWDRTFEVKGTYQGVHLSREFLHEEEASIYRSFVLSQVPLSDYLAFPSYEWEITQKLKKKRKY